VRRLTFVVPVHGRLQLAKICLRQLRRTCDALEPEGVHATAIVVSDPETLAELELDGLGFGFVERDNDYLGRRFNDGIQLAADPSYNPEPADFVVPFGSDDWADHRLFREPLPAANEIFGFRRMSFVNETATKIAATLLNYEGGAGIRIIPRELVAGLGYRPADEDRERGCDTSILVNLRRHHGDRLKVRDGWHLHDRQIVDWKSKDQQLNTFNTVAQLHQSKAQADPFGALVEYYPAEALEEMAEYYGAAVPARA
jgi:hypothetical protein